MKPENKLLSIINLKSWSTFLLAGIVFLAIATLYSCIKTQEKGGDTKQKSETIKIVTFGGTVTDGTSAKLDVLYDCFKWGTTTVNKVRETQTWWAILERILTDWVDDEVEVINTGKEGSIVAEGLVRIEDDVLSHSPDYVLVMFGMDDALAGVKADRFRDDLEKIVNRIEEEKVNVVLMTPPPISERMTVNCTMDELRRRQTHLTGLVQTIRDLVEEKSLTLIDFYQYFLDNRLAYDHLFEGWLPDAVAQSAMAPFVAGELLPVMGVNNYPNPTLGDYRKVYSGAKNPNTMHNAFTDLTYFKGEFYLTFRTGHSHSTPLHTSLKSDAIVVMHSEDGINWSKDAVLKKEGLDNRDPKFFQVEGRLMVYVPTVPLSKRAGQAPVVTYGFERISIGQWSEPFACAPCVFWRPKQWRGQNVVAVYRWEKKDAAVKLLSSKDGRNWEVISNILPLETDGDETDLFVVNDKLTAFSRAEWGSDFKMLISTYVPSDNHWETVSTGRIIHAPCVFKVGERLMITGRYMSQSDDRFRELEKDWHKFTQGTPSESFQTDPARVEEYHHGLRTGIFVIDGTRPRLVMELLSAGDSSYPGVVEYGDEYVISDYSMHEYYPVIRKPGDWETPSDIYVSRVRFVQ